MRGIINNKQRVAVLGASDKPESYANRAVRLLLAHGHEVVPLNPRLKTVEGLAVIPDLAQITGRIDTLTLYVSSRISSTLQAAILQLHPGRVIFNPGAENEALRTILDEHGIVTENACTLVLLNTGQF